MVGNALLAAGFDGLRIGPIAACVVLQASRRAWPETVDRIRIGDDLLSFAGIRGDVTLIGAYRKAQIWAGEKKPKTKKLDVAAFRAALARRKEAKKQ